MSIKKMSPETAASDLANMLREDPAAEQEFRANPVKFLQERFDWNLPEGCRVEIHDNTEEVWHIPMPAERAALGDAALAGVAGGAGGWLTYRYDKLYGPGNWSVNRNGLVIPTQVGLQHMRNRGR